MFVVPSSLRCKFKRIDAIFYFSTARFLPFRTRWKTNGSGDFPNKNSIKLMVLGEAIFGLISDQIAKTPFGM